jgi:flavin reductase (DIM6/NTAB) family NADH-FMN oxidoreductase RutF
MTFDSKKQRKIMGQFATGVTVVTTGGSAGQHGLTANAVASLSLNPPLVMVAVEKTAHSIDCLRKNRCFAINILRLDQEHISRRFAKPGPKDFSDLHVKTATTGSPILPECVANVDCRVIEIFPGGDHEIFVGEIVGGEFHGGKPLLYHAGGYHRLAEHGDPLMDHKVALGAGMSNTKGSKATHDPKST